MNNTWIRELSKPSSIQYDYKLFCLPYAGAGASVFTQWQRYFEDARIKVCPILLPGRENRIQEKPVDNARELAKQIYDGIKNELNGRFLIFGHSMGGIVAYELASLIYEIENKLPEVLFLSGTALRERPLKNHFYDKSENEFIEHIIENEGIPPQVAENYIFRQFFLPVLRNDYKLSETYCYNGKQLPTKVCAFFSREDREVFYKETLALKKVSEKFNSVEFSGGHFFINNDCRNVCRSICREIGR